MQSSRSISAYRNTAAADVVTDAVRNPLIIGAGPAGLTAALRLTDRGVVPRIYEATGEVGGLARTPTDGTWRVDPGGHRFFTKDAAVHDLWQALLPADQWIPVARRSAMLVNGHYVRYPLAGRDLLTQLGLRSGLRGAGSLLSSRVRGRLYDGHGAPNFRDWGTREFGRYWYDMFFDGYVRKTWLTEPADLASDWANQRIRPIRWDRAAGRTAATPETFQYPRLGPGQLWEAAASKLAEAGVVPALNSRVAAIRRHDRGWTVELDNGELAHGDAVFSSMPLRMLVEALEPAAPREIRVAAADLKHRALITVAVALQKRYEMPYNWVYTPGPEFRVGRIQNYGQWSRHLAPEHWHGTYLGLEYFVNPDGELWAADEDHLKNVVAQDLRTLGCGDSRVERWLIVRSRFAYPIYDRVRETSVGHIRSFLRRNHPSLHPIGRNGRHHYDNQDHAMLSAMHSVEQYFGADVDPWQVNTDRRYHEIGLHEKGDG